MYDLSELNKVAYSKVWLTLPGGDRENDSQREVLVRDADAASLGCRRMYLIYSSRSSCPYQRTKHSDNDFEVTQLCAQEFKILLL